MSLTIGIRFLTGYCATARSRVDPAPEWPPHPARLYLAMAAVYFESGEAADERAALEWLESLEPPTVCVSSGAITASAVASFVPMNDSKSIGHGGTIQSASQLKRSRKERLFPRTHLPPEQDAIFLSWQETPQGGLDRHRSAIESLCSRIGRLGHSTSLVQIWLADEVPEELDVLEPCENAATCMLRVVSRTTGTLDRLTTAFKTPPSYRAEIKTAMSYRPRTTAIELNPVGTNFDPKLILLKLRPDASRFQWMQLETTLLLARTLRQALLRQCDEPVPESISGHEADGAASKVGHIAILPLAFVSDSNTYADGHLLGVAIAQPAVMSQEDRRHLEAAIRKITDEAPTIIGVEDDGERRIGSGLGFSSTDIEGLGQWRLEELGLLESLAHNLRADTWTASTAGCRSWATVTPVVFDNHGKSRGKAAYLDECAASIKESIARVVRDASIVELNVTGVSAVYGVPTARQFPRLKRKDGSERRHMHVQVLFNRPVVGPLLAGAGRYRGYGLFRPMREGNK
jgi:CRISPR-associated protein Csb2